MQPLRKILEMNQQKICSGSPVKQTMNSPQATSSNSNDAHSQSKRLDLMFSRFAAFYGHVWRSQFKHEGFLEFAKKEWADALSSFNDEVLNKVILHCRTSCEMPPTLPQVIGYCRQMNKRSAFYVASKDSTSAAPEVVTQHLKQCKAFLINR